MPLPVFLNPLRDIPVAGPSPFSARPAGGGRNPLAFQMQSQMQPQWCWAATAASVNAFKQTSPVQTQCEVASACFGSSCCTQPDPCNKPYYLDRALNETGNFVPPIVVDALRFDQIVHQIDTGNPVCCHISWRGGGGHFNAIYGYDAQHQDVDLGDPLYPGPHTLPYATFVNNYRGSGSWDYSYLTK